MTSQHPLLNDWQQRTASLRRLIGKNSKSAWIFEIRVKILNYLISRYGKTVGSETTLTSEGRSGDATRTARVIVR